MSRSSITGSACTRPWATAPRPRRGPAWKGSTCARPRDVLIPPLHSSGGGPLPTRDLGDGGHGHAPQPPAAEGRDRLIAEPDRQAPALPEGGLVVGPVGDPVPLPGDAVTASGVGLERHGRGPGIVGGAAPLPRPAPRRHPDRSVHQGDNSSLRVLFRYSS